MSRIVPVGYLTFREAAVKIEDALFAGVPNRAIVVKFREAEGERRVPALLNRPIEIYLNQSRPALIGSRPPSSELWISSTTGEAMTKKNLGTLISKITLETLGVDVSPHLFRTAAASMAAAYGGNTPHLASAILNHTDPRVTDEHYIRSTSVSAAKIYAEMVSSFVHE